MNVNRVLALLYRDFLTLSRLKWRLAETFYFPITAVLIWGFFSVFMKNFSIEAGLIVLVMNIYWNFAYSAQSTTNMSMLEDVWSGSLKQLFLSGITNNEFVVARLIFSAIVSVVLVVVMFVISFYAFHLPILTEHWTATIILTTLTLFSSLALSVLVAAFIFGTSREYSFLAWTVLQVFILLSAPFYTVDTLPAPLQYVSQAMPFTAIFQAARELITTDTLNQGLVLKGLLISSLYFALSFPVYYFAFNMARKNGNLVRLS